MFLQKFMGQVTIDNRAFYKQILVLGAPVALQNFFQALVNMLDVFMIGQLGAAEVTAVAITNTLGCCGGYCLSHGKWLDWTFVLSF